MFFKRRRKIDFFLKIKKYDIFLFKTKYINKYRMLSVNYISSFLEKNQEKIKNYKFLHLLDIEKNENIEFNEKEDLNEKCVKNNYNNIDISLEKYFNKGNFGLLKINDKNNNYIFSLFSSLLGIGKEDFYLLDNNDKINIIKNFIKKMDDSLFLENNYKKFGYDKNRFFNKEKISTVLKEAYQFRVNENFYLLVQYSCDFLGINLFLFDIKNNEIDDKKLFKSNKYKIENEEFNKYLPNYCLIKKDDIFSPILINNDENINYIVYDNHKDENIFKLISEFNCSLLNKQKEKKQSYKNMKIDELRSIVLKNGFSIHKISTITQKEIKRTKQELIDILNES